MKKLYTLAKWKKHSQSRKRRILKRRELNRKYGDPPSMRNKFSRLYLFPKNLNEYIELPVPEHFSFIDNTEEILNYLATAKYLISERNILFFDKKKVKIMTSDAIALLVAHLGDARFHRHMPIQGNAPAKLELQQLFVQSGFYDYVKSEVPRKISDNLLLHNFSRRRVKPQIAKEASLIGIKHTFENEEIFEPLYEILIECMSNTNNHAGRNQRAIYNWWLYVYKNPANKVTHYTFIDLGVGIFNSLPVRGYLNQILQKIGLISNMYIWQEILKGKIRSRTEDPLRGKGLPQIYEHSKHKNIKNFKIISNNIYSDLSTDNHREMKSNFNGTFLYWELHP